MDLTILMPFYNEDKQIDITVSTLLPILEQLDIEADMLLVDDGSSDRTWDAIAKASAAYPNQVRGLKLSRNFGKEAAICAGLDVVDSHAVILMDGDLQHPPKHIPEMVQLWRSGYDVVEGIKSDRGNESALSRINAGIFYGLFRKVAGYDLSNASDFKLLDRAVIEKWRSLKEYQTFFRGLSAWLGFKRCTFSFEVADRQTGQSRWRLSALVRLSVNAITAFSSVPLHIITLIGALFFLGSFLLIIQTLFNYFSGNANDGFTTVILVVLVVGACIMVSLGLLGIYVGKIFEEVKGRPRYIISDDTNIAITRGRDLLNTTTNKEDQ
jgi:dolichol-phosphate mannosyltransferase